MKVLIIGSGLIGITTAYLLRLRGYDVTVLDREDGPGQGTSFANAALLTPSMSSPWNAPGSWRVLLASLGRSDAPLQLRLRTLPTLADWGMCFLQNSQPAIFERNTLANLHLAQYSLQTLEALRRRTGIAYDRAAHGTLRTYRDRTAYEHACSAAARLSEKGLRFRALSVEEVVELEPALAPLTKQLMGAIHYETDETGDAYQFCIALAEIARKEGVQFHFGTKVSSLERKRNEVTAALDGGRGFVADRYIVAAGSYSTSLLGSAGIHLPVKPVKGYSLTFDRPAGETLPRIPIADDQLHAVVTPLEGTIRVAGTAEFAGYDFSLPVARIRNLLALLHEVLPAVTFDPTSARPWCGLRATSPDGVPIVGPTPISNLFVNTGHGHLGWTMAAGSAQMLADVVAGDTPSIDPSRFSLARFVR